MNFYDLAEHGYHTPLTAGQISELFYAGRLAPHSACRLLGKTQWRTIDEIFPLLKYNSSAASVKPPEEKVRGPMFARREVVSALIGGAVVGLAMVFYFDRAERPTNLSVPVRDLRLQSARHQYSITPALASVPPVTSSSNTSYPQIRNSSGAVSGAAPVQPVEVSTQAVVDNSFRFEQARRDKAQLQREQAATAERMRTESAQREIAQREAAGRDEIVPLDKFVIIEVGGASVSVKIRDNDVTSFDAWINGAHYREIKKQKGITRSGTDETLIYSGGGASLYYVWEISGELNHCRLRVRKT